MYSQSDSIVIGFSAGALTLVDLAAVCAATAVVCGGKKTLKWIVRTVCVQVRGRAVKRIQVRPV